MTSSEPSRTVESETNPTAGTSEELEALLAYLKQSRGFDFTAYKRSGLMRRVLVRMQTVGISRFTEYQDYLEVDTEEFTRLFNTILINVTTFFRDAPAWEYLSEHVLGTLVGGTGARHRVRVWSAGCASGEEAYSIAMLLAERIGLDQFRERVKIYATDVDEDALNQARQAVYTPRGVEGVPADLLAKYFDQTDGRYTFNKELRRSVIFGRHDLIQDAPISRVGLLICRNCLMYFNSEAQSRILSRFHFALVEGGILFLGKAETLLTQTTVFGALDIKRRLFTKTERIHPSDRPALFDPLRHLTPDETDHTRLRHGVSELSPVAQLLVDGNGVVVHANERMRTLFGMTERDVGRRLQDLEISYRPFELRSSIDRAQAEKSAVHLGEIAWAMPTGETVNLELQVVPISDGNNSFAGVGVFYNDVTRQRKLQEEVRRSNQELETALEELQSTNEELETTNEELQSTVEELETTNEELQSTNEELQTMNEELQSTNEELQSINNEARERGHQLGDLNAFLESVLTSISGGVIVVDTDLRVHKWNAKAADMWGLHSAEVLNKNFLNLDIGLPVHQLRAPIRSCLAREIEHGEVTLDAINRRGKPICVKVSFSPLLAAQSDVASGVILVVDEMDPEDRG